MTTTDQVRPSDGFPAALTSFVGRRRELSEARQLLSSSRLLTLTGMGGVGKTRLAFQLAATVRRAFPDGECLVELAELKEPGLLPQTVAAALGLRDEAATPMSCLAEHLADKQLLLVLDNCEHMPDACAMLLNKLLPVAPQVKVLTTSRHRLGVEGEQLMEIPPLPVPTSLSDTSGYEALALFTDRAAAAVPGFTVTSDNADDVIGICRRLDGMPLAIELAAVWLRTLTPAQILARLDDRFALLTRRARTGVPRHQTLEAAVDWSFDLCEPRERLLWARLSVFSGSFDLEAAEDVCSGPDLPRAEILPLIAGLVDKSILTRQEHGHWARYRMLDTIQAYGLSRLGDPAERNAVRMRHCDYYRRLSLRFEGECFGPHQVEWLQLMRREHPNLRVALEYCLTERNDAETALEVAGPTYHWISSGYLREGLAWQERAMALDDKPTAARAKALWVRSFLAILLGESLAPQRMLAECHDLAERLDKTNIFFPKIWQCEGLAAYLRGDLHESRAKFECALQGHLDAGHLHCAFDCMLQLGLIALRLDDPAAGELSRRCLDFCAEHNAQWSKSYALWLMGLHSWREGNPDRGIGYLQDSIRVRAPVDDSPGLTFSLEGLAWCEAARDRWARAAQLFGAADAVRRRTGAHLSTSMHRFAHDEVERRVREGLGAAAYDRAYRQGADLSLDQATALALEEKRGIADDARRIIRPANELSRRETEIAELVARGMSNREIAGALVISTRTAESHVEHILAKLGFTSRTQIAAWMTTNTLEQR